MTIFPVGDELFHTERLTNRQTDICDEDNNPFSQVYERAKKITHIMEHL